MAFEPLLVAGGGDSPCTVAALREPGDRFGRVAYGIQCHLETSREDLEAWLELFPDTVGLFESRHGHGSLPPFLDEYGAFVPRLRETGRQLFGRWLENALASAETTGPFERARTELLYGSRLVQAGRPVEATDRLTAALRVFEELGAEPWAGRARTEIVAAGGAFPEPKLNRLDRLTPLELEVALASAGGAPLDDVAHRLFLGPRSARLLQASAMAKLGADSRAELVGALGPELSPDERRH